MQGDPATTRSRTGHSPALGAIVRLPPLILALLGWIAAAHLQGFLFAATLPDLAAGLTFALALRLGPTGLLCAAVGWLLCWRGGAGIGALADPIEAAIHFLAYGLLGLVARHDDGGRPHEVRGVLSLWAIAAVAAALAATLAALLRTADQPGAEFLRAALGGWLGGLAGIAVVLVPSWSTRAAQNAAAPALAVAITLAAAVSAAMLALWPLDETNRLALFAALALIGGGGAALGAGLGGVAVHGVLLTLAMLWLARLRLPLPPWPAWLAMLALAQIAATVLAVAQESRWRLAAQRRVVEQDAAQQQRLELLQLVADHSADVVSVHAANFDFCYASPQLNRLLGLAADEQPTSLAALLPRLHPADRPAALPAELPASGRWRFRIRGGNHHWHWLESSYTAVGEGETRRYVVITRDIGAHIEQTETLHAMALHDPLTQLYNRRAANSLGERAWAEAVAQRMPFAVVLLDIDHFKRINDTYGHDAGDEVIKRVAAILHGHTRQRDLVCRWGGEEFLMLLPESDAEGACQIAERVRGEVASTAVMVGNQRLLINISAGVAERSDSDIELAAVIERADQGLYAAKEQGRNRVVPMRKAG